VLTLPRFLTGKNILLTIAVLFLVLVTVRYAGNEKEQLNPVEGVLRDGLAPVYRIMTAAGQRINDWVSYPVALVEAARENEQLKKKISRLEARLRDQEELAQENKRLKRLLRWQQQEGRQYASVVASVIARDPGNWFGTLVINKGREDGIKPNMTVVTPTGLVGRIANVSGNTAEVLLITDPRSGVGALLQKTRAPGIVEGIASGSAYLRMNHIPGNLMVTEGETVVTSGQGSIFPKGIAIGAVVDVDKETSGLFKVATIKPYVDFNRMEEVLVIK